jgi:hypothetical protein
MHDNARPESMRRVFGFPDFAPTVEAEYPRFFEVGQRALNAMHSVADRDYPAPEPHQRAILNLSMLAGIALVEVVTLTVNGLGHGAMRTMRSLLETAINTEYFRQHPESFDDYREWYHVERFKELEFLRQHAPEILARIDAGAVADIKRNMARVRARFLMRDSNGKSRGLRSGWSSLNLDARADATGYTELYRLINPMASSFIHETMYGLLRHFRADDDPHRVEVPPILKWSKEALSGAHNCMVGVVRTLSQAFGVAPEPTVEVLEQEWRYAWTDPRWQPGG